MRVAIIFLILLTGTTFGQDLSNARRVLTELSSKELWGRGYTRDGMTKAADYIATEFKSCGLVPLTGKTFFQPFSYPVNTFPGKVEVAINGKQLKPGSDFIISPESKGIKTSGPLVRRDSVHFVDQQNKLEVVLQKKLTWSVSTELKDYTTVIVDKWKLNETPTQIQLVVENKFIPKFKASNVCGLVRGASKPDSLILITAHYDHLGGMGKEIYFPGANDDASGVTLLLSLAKYYGQNPPPYSIVFISFAGEEAGLVGSEYFVENSPIKLKQIRILINLDLVGTGDEGITVVNGSIFKREFSLLNEINDQKKYLSKIKMRGKAASSDHYWFTEKGVPSFFIYAMGGIQAYHDVYDKAETLPLTEFEDLFQLIVDFNNRLMN